MNSAARTLSERRHARHQRVRAARTLAGLVFLSTAACRRDDPATRGTGGTGAAGGGGGMDGAAGAAGNAAGQGGMDASAAGSAGAGIDGAAHVDARSPADVASTADAASSVDARSPRDAGSALDAIFGWTILDDVSARNVQFKENQITLGKGPDTFCPLGPEVVTADELGDWESLHVSTTLNGETMQSSPASDMLFAPPVLLEFLTALVTLEPGASVPEHDHPHEQLGLVVDGELVLAIAGAEHRLRAGQAYQIPGGVGHAAWTEEGVRCRVLDVFQPVREDYRERFERERGCSASA